MALLQPVLMGMAGLADDRLRLHLTLNLEGAVMAGGDLAPGNYGEGFVDRRHPHTWLHEALAVVGDPRGTSRRARVAMALGKGFVPFGTDDPMGRPFLRFPVNHHLAQLPERIVGLVGVRAGPVALESALFNGDEPQGPGTGPEWSRFGDSWSARATVFAGRGVELQGSHAFVRSPEYAAGAGNDQRKWSASARWAGAAGGTPAYILGEWARTDEATGAFTCTSLLAEGAVTLGRHELALRVERTDRPEEERLDDPFRSPRPHFEVSNLGISRWSSVTAAWWFTAWRGPGNARVVPVAEVTVGTMHDRGGGLFRVREWYGGETFWALGLGVRVAAGPAMRRMGRYGVLAEPPAPKGADDHVGH